MAAPRTSQRGGDSNPATVKELSSAIVAMAMQDHIARDLGLTQALTRPRVPRGPRLRQRGQGGPEGGPSRGTGGGPGGGPSGGPDEEREYVLGPRAPPLTLAQRLCLVPAPQGAALSQEEWRFVKSRSAQRDLFSLPCVICRDELGAHTQVLLSCSHVFHQAAGVVEGRLCPGAVPPPPRVRAAPRPRAAPPLLREQAAGAGRASGSCVRLRRGRLPAGDGGGARAASTAERGGERQLGLGAHRGHGAHTEHPLTHTPCHTHRHTHTPSHTHLVTHTVTHTPRHTHRHTHTPSHTHPVTHRHTHTLSHTVTHTHPVTHSHSTPPHTHTPSHTPRHTHRHTFTQSHRHTVTLSHTLSHTPSHCQTQPHKHTITHPVTQSHIHTITPSHIPSHRHTVTQSHRHTVTTTTAIHH
ncbi:uncharacterized protein LOC144943552 isoform X3 [Lampetra fluviatilis]